MKTKDNHLKIQAESVIKRYSYRAVDSDAVIVVAPFIWLELYGALQGQTWHHAILKTKRTEQNVLPALARKCEN